MGFDTHMIAGSRACSTITRPTRPNITNQTSPYYAEGPASLIGKKSIDASSSASI
jgi:hypothetical protein